jgi:hypothetical protein
MTGETYSVLIASLARESRGGPRSPTIAHRHGGLTTMQQKQKVGRATRPGFAESLPLISEQELKPHL